MLESFFEEIQQLRSAQLLQNATKYPRNNVVASDISPCTRETALGVLHWQDRPDFSVDLLARFEVGNDQENIANAKMLRLGIKIVEQQQSFELRDKEGRIALRGRIDGKVEINGRKVPFDYKTLDPNAFDRLNTIDDFLEHQFFSKYPKQIWAYEYMNDIDIGFLWLDNLKGKWKFIEVPMDWVRMEMILRQCETATESIDAIRKGAPESEALPPYHYDPSYCLKCWAWKKVCLPPFFSGEGMKIVNDPEFADRIKRRAEIKPLASEYEKLDKEIKDTLKEAMKPGDNWIIGEFLVSAEEKSRRIKAKPAVEAHTDKYLGLSIEPIDESAAIEKSDADYEALSNGGGH